MSNDITKKIIYGADGIPLGSNGGISMVLSKAFGSRLHMTVTSSGYYFDNKTRKWSGVFSKVSEFHSNKNWLLLKLSTSSKVLSSFKYCVEIFFKIIQYLFDTVRGW